MRISGYEVLIVLLLVVLLFGAKRLPDLARSIGKAFKAFKREIRDVKSDLELDDDKNDRSE
jgi:sec-independent protein translocase protein TatA